MHKLYNLVMERGGYDKLSAERMAWRQLVKPLGFSHQHEGAATFQLKTLYYKQLGAYEIAKYWNETPPPKEILEDQTAKGGDLRSRTVANYNPGGMRESMSLQDTQDSADDDQTTPKKDRAELEEPGSGGRYPTRSLRQDPKKTQLFQPEAVSTRGRYMRTTSSPQPAPAQPTYSSATSDPRNSAFNLLHYEPRQPMALTLRPVITPGSNPDLFYQRKAIAEAQRLPRIQLEPQTFLKGVVQNMQGPNIYIRCLYGLRSGIPEEQNFALHHLVKVSFERGDKYKFEGFPLLAESLLDKALEIMQVVYGAKWAVSYDAKEDTAPDSTFNAAYGTPDLLQRLSLLKAALQDPGDASDEDSEKMEKLNEAALVLRNMVILEENAKFISQFPLFRDFLTIAISLPPQPRLAEFRHYALEMAEQVTRYYYMLPKDPLYTSMVAHLDQPDRAMVLSALRAINRIGMELEPVFRISNISLTTIERLISMVLLESDDELVEACLDFLYEYTAIWDNNHSIFSQGSDVFTNIMPRLIKLMNHNPTTTEEAILNKPKPTKEVIPATIPSIPSDLYQQLLQFAEPARSSRWLKCCFEESREDDITQIAIWQAYQGRFQMNQPIPAAEFIKNVSSTFTTAQAQVINGPQPRFIIKGIRPRRLLIDTQGSAYWKCLWQTIQSEGYDPNSTQSQRQPCSVWQSSRKGIWTHILQDHLGVGREADGRFKSSESGEYRCRWAGCMRSTAFSKPNEIGLHLRTHVPERVEDMTKLILEVAGVGPDKEPDVTKHTSYYTACDNDGTPVGIPFMSVMIMRNLARFANKHGALYQKNGQKLMDRLFAGVMRDIWSVFSFNRTLRWLLGQLIGMIEKGEAGEDRGTKREREDEEETQT